MTNFGPWYLNSGTFCALTPVRSGKPSNERAYVATECAINYMVSIY